MPSAWAREWMIGCSSGSRGLSTTSFCSNTQSLEPSSLVPIIPSGDNIYTAEFIRQGIEAGSWDAGRFDATEVGGISKALELLMIADDADLPNRAPKAGVIRCRRQQTSI